MSSDLTTEKTEESLSSTTLNTNADNNFLPNESTTEMDSKEENSTTTVKKKKKKKKKGILYQQTAVKYYNGFMKNKRYKKGINLSTGCAIFKTAWELPESNGLILPSRVVRHFKQVLPKKPPPKKKQIKTKAPSTDTNNTNTVRVSVTEMSSTSNMLPEDDPFIIRSRTMQDMHGPPTSFPHISPPNAASQHGYNRTMLTLASTEKNTVSLINAQNEFCDQIEAMIDEQKVEEDTVEIKRKKHMISKSVDITDEMYDEYDIDIAPKHKRRPSSPSPPQKPEIKLKLSDTALYDDHAHIIEDDLKPDAEEHPVLEQRAQTDFRHMSHEDVEDHMLLKNIEKKEEHKENTVPNKTKKKKKKKNPILYAEVATKYYKKMNDGKRFKKGITLRRACHIMSVAWELPEDNGRILPSKVARHFKHVLPSKKTAKNVKTSGNIKPSLAMKSNDDNKPQTMRGHVQPNWLGVNAKQSSMRRSLVELSMKKGVAPMNKPKQSMISHLESLMASDPNRIRNDDQQGQVVNKRSRAVSEADLDLDILEHELMENEIVQLLEEKKKKEQEKKEKENDAINAIAVSFDL